jgi:phosphatidylglycerophosphate synthase
MRLIVTPSPRRELQAASGAGPGRAAGIRVWWRAGEALRIGSGRSPGLWWIRRVNRRVGAFIALGLLETSVSPNVVSVLGLVATLVGGVIVAVSNRSVEPVTVLIVFLVWQLAFSLDCADGQLARARGQSTPFGAWLDQVLDFVSHSIVFTALTIFVVRTNEFDEPLGAAFGAAIVALSVIQLFAGSQRNALMGTIPAVDHDGHGKLRRLGLGRHLTDYGWMLAGSSILLLWPPILFWFLVAFGLFNGLTVLGQIATNWIAEGQWHDHEQAS